MKFNHIGLCIIIFLITLSFMTIIDLLVLHDPITIQVYHEGVILEIIWLITATVLLAIKSFTVDGKTYTMPFNSMVSIIIISVLSVFLVFIKL